MTRRRMDKKKFWFVFKEHFDILFRCFGKHELVKLVLWLREEEKKLNSIPGGGGGGEKHE